MNVYDSAYVMLDGQPLAFANGPTCDATISFSAECQVPSGPVDEFIASVLRAAPAQSTGVVTVSLPWSILGTIRVDVAVTGGGAVSNGVEMTGDIEPKAMRRAVSMAVERAIVTRFGRDNVALGVQPKDGAETFRMANSLLGRLARDGLFRGRYHCERKARKAMRRLLRAAGATREP